jgi:hypothetical protein
LKTGVEQLKRFLPYLLAIVLTGAIVLLFITGRSDRNRQFNDRVTLRRQDKIPYATYVAFRNLPELFPGARVLVSKKEPGYWDSVSVYDKQQAFICITDRFGADESEMNKLLAFARSGNDVFISARYISSVADEFLQCGSSATEYLYSTGDNTEKTRFTLNTPPFTDTVHYTYPGRTFYSYFSHVDTTTTQVLGFDDSGRPDFIRLSTGKGHFYIHLEPLAFSNYFLLHEQNIGYYEKALSVISPDVTKIVWDEYYLNKAADYNPPKKKGWMSVLMSVRNQDGNYPFRAAFWLLMGILILYVLMEMRRRQRLIPVIKKPLNDSLDFVKTIGRLYYDRSDHRNLCRKMSAYFLEFVRSSYKLPTGLLNEDFIRMLHYKSGVPEKEVADIVTFIKYLEQGESVNEKQLASFHKRLESFYQKA